MGTGSSESILSKSALNAVCPDAVLAPTSVRIHGVTGHQLQFLDETMLRVQSESGVSIPIRFLVSAHSPSILGLRAMRLLQGSITLHTNNHMPITSHFQHLLVQCSGTVGGMKVPSVRLNVDGKPIFLKRRVLPYGQRYGVLKALQKIEQDDVINKVKSSAWATPTVVAMKSDDIIIKGLDGVLAYQDDVLIFGPNKKEHDARLTQLLERFAAGNVAIKAVQVTRFKPLTNIESPKDQTHLRSVMGCLKYCSRFIPNFATRAQPLFGAQCSEAWEWSVECEDILRDLIRCVTDRPVLSPFSPSKPTTLITDASDVGIGAVLEQEGCPVICTSRLLNAAENGYSPTQKKALAVFWAVRRLHKYLFGLWFTIITDHQALQFLFNPNKSIAMSTAAMQQRWSIALAACNYDIQHRPGKTIPQADFLSRYS
ncbi:unnamed protein product [Echinostoma caproni]|uniref:RT_RNaseH domain-containing protein n=1 Tax=Echinostoma caproni TaxID=27848 RepID=A0A183A031_9TREM|nr:unnamed protein product [Echinostoma caproni]